MRAILFAFAIAAATPAAASTLRTATTLNAPVVRLSDLFDDAGSDSARVLGPAPGPGQRIVVEAAQLAAIARQFGVEWRPASPADRAVLDRPGRPLPREAVLAPLRTALAEAGAPPGVEIEIPAFAAPMIPPDARADASIEQIDYDAASGRFTASLVLTGGGMETQHLRVSGQAAEMIDAVVPVRRIAAGATVAAADVQPARIRAAAARSDLVRDVSEVIGRGLRHAMYPGQPIATAELMRPLAVAKGDRVAIELRAPGINLGAQGIAMAAGAIGESVAILNPSSRALVEAEIVGPDRVRVRPGATPLAPPTDSGAQVAIR